MHLAFAGGVGGAKLAHGLSRILPPEALLIAVNTGDDFDHLGLRICPDLDTVMYTLAGIANPETGWGVRDETWRFMDDQAQDDGETWFRIGDRDRETHLARRRMLDRGDTLSMTTRALCRDLGIRHAVVPMSDDPVATIVKTDDGDLPFQDYFVRRRCEPPITGFDFAGAANASPAPALTDALAADELESIFICPSNPYVSIGPILAIPALVSSLKTRKAPCVAVSPIVGGKALKGPAAKMMSELGIVPSCRAVAEFYGDLIDGLVIDGRDAQECAEIEALGIACLVTDTVMKTDDDRARLADRCLRFAGDLAE